MNRALTIAAIAALTITPVLAQQDQAACRGDPKCAVVDDDHPVLRGANGIYYPSTDQIYLSGKIVTKGDCAKYLYDHEAYHREQNRRGELAGNEWAEREAQQNAPVYNCGGDGPRSRLSDY